MKIKKTIKGKEKMMMAKMPMKKMPKKMMKEKVGKKTNKPNPFIPIGGKGR